MDITFEKVESGRIKELAAMTNEIWHEYFPCILSDEQIDYMVDKFQSERAITAQISDGYEYYFICKDGMPCGYMGLHCEAEKMFLSKLYLKKEMRGLGIAGKAFNFIFTLTKKYGKGSVYLTVNKHNQHSIDVYKHKGFEIMDSVVTDIGNGYVMDDYIFQKNL
ncbi:MAG: GNAT family N-acetyltransferase [Ruminiclostridium sp.]